MVIFFIFLLHIVFSIYIFTKKKKAENTTAGIMNLALIAFLFAVGWAFTGFVTNLLFEPEGYGKELNRDTLSLLLLTILETIFYYIYYYKDKNFNANGKERQ